MRKYKFEDLTFMPLMTGWDPRPCYRQMSRTLLILSTIASLFWVPYGSAQNFDAEYTELISEFKTSLNNSQTLESLVKEADALHDRIRQYRSDKGNDLSKEERKKLRQLYRQVKKFETVTRTVGQLKNISRVSIKNFDALSTQLTLEPRVIQELDSGLKLVRIDLGSFASILLHNPTKNNYSVMYSTNDAAKSSGIGVAFCESYAVLSGLFNSRDREIENLDFTFQIRKSSSAKCK